MKLTDEERNSLVILQLEKAKVFLKQADEMFDLKYWDIASNRYYYACFHAVQALLIQNGLSCKTHDGLIACFGLNFIKTGKISARLGSFLARMEQLRQKGDYNCIYSISEDEISTIKAPARELIETIEDTHEKKLIQKTTWSSRTRSDDGSPDTSNGSRSDNITRGYCAGDSTRTAGRSNRTADGRSGDSGSDCRVIT